MTFSFPAENTAQSDCATMNYYVSALKRNRAVQDVDRQKAERYLQRFPVPWEKRRAKRAEKRFRRKIGRVFRKDTVVGKYALSEEREFNSPTGRHRAGAEKRRRFGAP